MHETVCEWFLALTILTYQSIHATLRSNILLLMDERAPHIHIHFRLNPSSRHLQLIGKYIHRTDLHVELMQVQAPREGLTRIRKHSAVAY